MSTTSSLSGLPSGASPLQTGPSVGRCKGQSAPTRSPVGSRTSGGPDEDAAKETPHWGLPQRRSQRVSLSPVGPRGRRRTTDGRIRATPEMVVNAAKVAPGASQAGRWTRAETRAGRTSRTVPRRPRPLEEAPRSSSSERSTRRACYTRKSAPSVWPTASAPTTCAWRGSARRHDAGEAHHCSPPAVREESVGECRQRCPTLANGEDAGQALLRPDPCWSAKSLCGTRLAVPGPREKLAAVTDGLLREVLKWWHILVACVTSQAAMWRRSLPGS